MSKFDMIIGYSAVKKELQQIADTLKNQEYYKKLGVSAPRGLLLYGEPGVGKSLMAAAVIEASGRQAFVCRKDQPNGDFVKQIKETFDQAIENAPSIVLLDDMDKFANGDECHPDAEEYVTVQSCIDNAKDKEVFVIATVNNIYNLPQSLRRAGRFDRHIKIYEPTGKDAQDIIGHYLKSKKVAEDINLELIARIMDGRSCAELETVVNGAGIYAGYERADSIAMEHLMEACLQIEFSVPARNDGEEDQICPEILSAVNSEGAQIVYHEAGHAVVSELLCPESVTLAYVYHRGRNRGGFVDCYNDKTHTPLYWEKSRILCSLAGMAANEQKSGVTDIGGGRDWDTAFGGTKDLLVNRCINGPRLYSYGYRNGNSEQLRFVQEQAIAEEVEKFYKKAKEILARNTEFLEKVAQALAAKKLLTSADIQEIKNSCKIVQVVL
ncbi:MAG: AAA family ATPase [Oscillospiraceae bacterium]|nr:AAA family ATPase [Oscillospiraceae bacterium]